jgi:hypothetical protein
MSFELNAKATKSTTRNIALVLLGLTNAVFHLSVRYSAFVG